MNLSERQRSFRHQKRRILFLCPLMGSLRMPHMNKSRRRLKKKRTRRDQGLNQRSL